MNANLRKLIKDCTNERNDVSAFWNANVKLFTGKVEDLKKITKVNHSPFLI
jgi:hypothetical protein